MIPAEPRFIWDLECHVIDSNALRIVLLIGLLSAVLRAQEATRAEPLSEEAVKATLSFLADDAMSGRDTPSPGLERAADWIEARFKSLGLKPGAGESFSHVYEKPGLEFATDEGFLLEIGSGQDRLVLKPGKDARLFRLHRAFAEEKAVLDRYDGSANDIRAMRRAAGVRRPLLVEVEASSALWKQTAGKKRLLKPRFRGRPPVILVRKGLLPKGKIEGKIALTAPREVTLKLRNPVAVLPGTKRPEERIIISAHYDHVGLGLPRAGDGVYNGADDDATGTTAVLQLAEAFAASGARERSLVFVAFSAEEKGLLGSKAFAENAPFDLGSVVANLNLEMLGRPGNKKERGTAWMTGRDLSDLEKMLVPGFKRAGIKIREFEMQRQLFGASDNFSLARRGVVAQSISAGGLHEDYHQPSDEVAKIDLPHMTKVIRGIFEAAGDLADSKKKPAYNAKGMKAIAGRH